MQGAETSAFKCPFSWLNLNNSVDSRWEDKNNISLRSSIFFPLVIVTRQVAII